MSGIVIPQRRLWLPSPRPLQFASQLWRSASNVIYRNSGGNVIYDEQSEIEDCCCDGVCNHGDVSSVDMDLQNFSNPTGASGWTALFTNLNAEYSTTAWSLGTVPVNYLRLTYTLGTFNSTSDPGIEIMENTSLNQKVHVWRIRIEVMCCPGGTICISDGNFGGFGVCLPDTTDDCDGTFSFLGTFSHQRVDYDTPEILQFGDAYFSRYDCPTNDPGDRGCDTYSGDLADGKVLQIDTTGDYCWETCGAGLPWRPVCTCFGTPEVNPSWINPRLVFTFH